jgi:hypothetical protein
VTILFSSNLVGIVFARSLHYQFYAWYAHQIVFLAWHTPFDHIQKCVPLLSLSPPTDRMSQIGDTGSDRVRVEQVPIDAQFEYGTHLRQRLHPRWSLLRYQSRDALCIQEQCRA